MKCTVLEVVFCCWKHFFLFFVIINISLHRCTLVLVFFLEFQQLFDLLFLYSLLVMQSQQKGGNAEALFFFFLFFSLDKHMWAQLCGFFSSHIFQCACLLRIASCELCKCETLWRYFRQLKNAPFFCHRGKTLAKLYRRYLARCRGGKKKERGKKKNKTRSER